MAGVPNYGLDNELEQDPVETRWFGRAISAHRAGCWRLTVELSASPGSRATAQRDRKSLGLEPKSQIEERVCAVREDSLAAVVRRGIRPELALC